MFFMHVMGAKIYGQSPPLTCAQNSVENYKALTVGQFLRHQLNLFFVFERDPISSPESFGLKLEMSFPKKYTFVQLVSVEFIVLFLCHNIIRHRFIWVQRHRHLL